MKNHSYLLDDLSPNTRRCSPKGYAVIGFAMYYFTYDPWIGKLLYLEDFFIMQDFRGKVAGVFSCGTKSK